MIGGGAGAGAVLAASRRRASCSRRSISASAASSRSASQSIADATRLPATKLRNEGAICACLRILPSPGRDAGVFAGSLYVQNVGNEVQLLDLILR